ncbi:MAG: flagellar type III secretion system protein FlhB [Betaproteobacteria bacterium]|jgi:flagellar biosynthetic protein FlhB
MSDSAQDRTLPATGRKISKAREEGQVARSRDLGHFAALFAASLALAAVSSQLTGWLQRLLARGLSFDALTVSQPQRMADRLADFGLELLLVVLPMGLLMMAVGVAAGIACGGWNFSWKAMEPKFSKLDPISGVARLFKASQIGMTLKACLLALVLGLIGALFVQANMGRFLHSMTVPLPAALNHAAGTVWAGMLLLLVAVGAFALVDVPLQKFVWLRGLRMSHEEVKKEHKEVEGNAEIKGKQKARMREAANRRMLAAVPSASVVVMNPTHFAVALRYDDGKMSAPLVVAKGADLMAFRIRDAARAAQVPVLEAPPLARALYAHSEVDREIPAALFSAVAQVLAWVFQLRNAMAGKGRAPGDLPDLQVPPELDPKNQPAATSVPVEDDE